MQKSSVTSNEIPVTHWKPILNFHVLNEKVEFERQAIPSEIYPFIRYDGHSSNVDKKILECVYQKCTSMFSYKWSPSDRLWHLVEEKTFGKRKKIGQTGILYGRSVMSIKIFLNYPKMIMFIFVVLADRLAPNKEYLPVLYIDQLGVIYRYLKVRC